MTRRRTAALAALVVAGAMSLTGCGGDEGGAAARYDGETVVTVRELQSATEDVNLSLAERQPGQVATAQDVLSLLVLAPVITETAKADGIDVPAAAAIRPNLTGGDDGVSDTAVEFFRTSLAASQMTPQQLEQAITKAIEGGIEINPRYGTFDPMQGIVQQQPNWIDGAAEVAGEGAGEVTEQPAP